MLPDLASLKLGLMLPQFAQGGLEAVLNHLLSQTAHCEPYLRKLNNKILAVHLQGFNIPLFFVFSTQRIDVLGAYEDTPNCSVTISPRVLLQMPSKAQLSSFLNDQSIQLQGDLQVLQDFVALLEFLEKDPAELLSTYIGDVPAQSAVNLLTKFVKTLRFKLQQSQQFWGERLTEEWQVISPSLAIADFCEQVDQLEKDTAVLEQKINVLLS